MSKLKIKAQGVNIYVADMDKAISCYQEFGFSLCSVRDKEAILKDDYGFTIWLKDADAFGETPGQAMIGVMPDEEKNESSMDLFFNLLYSELTCSKVRSIEQQGDLLHSWAQFKGCDGVAVELCNLPISDEDI